MRRRVLDVYWDRDRLTLVGDALFFSQLCRDMSFLQIPPLPFLSHLHCSFSDVKCHSFQNLEVIALSDFFIVSC